jgi:type II secretory pathway component GspD/PulD (secretin)
VKTVMGLIKAIESTAQGQILHQPQILIADNEDAEINVTDNIPVPTEEITGGDNPVKAIKYIKEKVKIKLKITPQIGEDNELVKLKVEQAVDDFTPFTEGKQIQITERMANTTVTVRSGDTVAIGGLQKRDSKDQRSKLPILGDLPLIGWLFKGSTGSEQKTNLVLFLRPRIISEYRDILEVTSERLDQREKDGKKLYDPKDRHKDEVKAFKKKNAEDMAREAPRGWGIRGRARNSLSSDEMIDLEELESVRQNRRATGPKDPGVGAGQLSMPESLEPAPLPEDAPVSDIPPPPPEFVPEEGAGG